MTQSLNYEIFIIGTVVVMFTIGLLYTNALLDYDGDMASHKKTFCCRFGSKNKALAGYGIIYGTSYFLLIFSVYKHYLPYTYLITIFLLPFILELIISMFLYNKDSSSVPQKKFWHFPFENWEQIEQQGISNFRFRMYQARNIQIYFSILISFAIIFGK